MRQEFQTRIALFAPMDSVVCASRMKFGGNSCNSCPNFVAISVIGVYDAGAVTND